MDSSSSVIDQIMDQNREAWGDHVSLRLFPERIACVQNGDPKLLADIQKAQWESCFEYYSTELALKDTILGILLPHLCGCLTLAAVLGGLPLERSAAISGYFLEKIPEMTDVEAFLRCTDEMEIIFAQEVYRHKSYQTGNQAIDRCLTYIYEHIDWPIRLADLAQVCGYSISRIQYLFSLHTGVTITDYIRREKVKKAKFLLTYTDLSCAAVGQKLSFCSQSYFTKVFRLETGMTPLQYRESRSEVRGLQPQLLAHKS